MLDFSLIGIRTDSGAGFRHKLNELQPRASLYGEPLNIQQLLNFKFCITEKYGASYSGHSLLFCHVIIWP